MRIAKIIENYESLIAAKDAEIAAKDAQLAEALPLLPDADDQMAMAHAAARFQEPPAAQ